MAVRIRLSRAGRRHLPFYHIAVHDIRQRGTGREIDRIGFYDPDNQGEDKQIRVDAEKAQKWLADGAIPTETVAHILKKAGLELPERKKKTTKREAKPQRAGRKVKERAKKRTANSKTRKANRKED